MNAAEWERIKSLFDSALSIAPENRLNWLRDACADRPELYETVSQLIRNYEECSWANLRESESGPVFSPGQVVADRFLILRLIARGGMGEVYEARDNNLHGVRVALKTLRLGLTTERQAHDRFKREVWVVREIAHEGICRMFDLVEHRNKTADGVETVIPCLTMKLLEGESLTDFLARRRPLSTAEALPLIRQIAHSLQAMHDKEIVHRDLKPSNIMLVPDKGGDNLRVIIIDFGLAKRLNGKAELWETRTEQNQVGAPYFVAPEVLRGQKSGIAADLYAFGLLIDELVTHSAAFRYDSVEELFWRKLQEGPEPPSKRSDNLPPGWEQAILCCLHPQPDSRPQSALVVLDALENRVPLHVPNVESTAAGKQQRRAFAGTKTRAAVSRRVWIGTAAGSAVAVSGALGVLGTKPQPFTSSVLIFPFQNLTKRDEYNHLCTGIVEELMRRLSYIQGLSVLPIPKSWSPDPAAMRKARFSLKGSLQHFEDKVRLSVRLTENGTGALIWAETFDRSLIDPLALESEIAERTVDGMQKRVSESASLLSRFHVAAASLGLPLRRASGGSESLLPRQATKSSTAFDEYQRGRDLCQQRILPAALNAIASFERAIELDPNFALAYAALADVQLILLNYNYAPTTQLLSEALRYAEKGIALDDSLPECHVARAAARQNLWDWEESGESYQLAISKHPKFARSHLWYAGLLMQFARFDEALSRARIGLELDPFDYPAQSNFGLYLWNAGRVTEAASQLEGILEKVDLIYTHNVLGQVYADLSASSSEPEATTYFLRSLDEAAIVRLRDLEAAGGADPGYLKWSDLICAQAHSARRDRASAQHYANRLEQGFRAGKISASAVSWAYAAIDDRKRTLDLLEHGLEHREREMLNIRVVPLFKNLHGERRFQKILERMRLV